MGETLTWIVATIIIIVMLLIFVYASSKLATFKELTSGKQFTLSKEYKKTTNWIGTKNAISFSINNKNKELIENWIIKLDIKNN